MLKKNLFLLLIISVMMFTADNVNALKILDESNAICTTTKEYLIWDRLSPIEKSNTYEPVKCKEAIIHSMKTKIGSMIGTIGDVDPLTASSFNLKDYDKVSPLKDQEDSDLCWAFVTNEIVESNYKVNNPGKSIDLSEKHIDYNLAEKYSDGTANHLKFYSAPRAINSGGSYLMSSYYLSTGRGVVTETRLPWSTTTSTEINAHLKNDYHVDDTILLLGTSCHANSNNLLKAIKSSLVTTGAVATMMHGSMTHFADNKMAYYYSGTEDPRHGVTIVGWDDNYPATNFKTTPPGNGAWIVKDQQGEWDHGEDGYYYISYYDSHICRFLIAINGVSPANDNNYFHDSGFAGVYYVDSPSKMYYKNVFSKKTTKTEFLKKVNTFIGPEDSYKIYYSETGSLADAVQIASGTSSKHQYFSANNSQKIAVSNTYSIILEYTSSFKDSSGYYFPVDEIKADENRAGLTGGKSFYSFNGTQWNDSVTTSSTLQFYPILRAFTDVDDRNITIGEVASSVAEIDNLEGGEFTIPVILENISSMSNLTLKIHNTANIDQTSKFTVTSSTTGFKIVVKPNETPSGTFKVTIATSDGMISKSTTILVKGTNEILISDITIGGLSEVSVGGTLDLSVTINPTDASNKTLTWSSSDNTIATVTNGTVKGVKKGTVTITATSTDGSNKSATKTVAVIETSTIVAKPIDAGGTVPNPGTNIGAYSLISFVIITGVGVLFYLGRKKNKFNHF